MHINDAVKKIHKTAYEKGWWDKPRSALEIHALICSEIGEATEEVRLNTPYVYKKDEQGTCIDLLETFWKKNNHLKPEGEAVELVDCFIRIADYFEEKGWNFEKVLIEKMRYNEKRPYRHGNKKY
jgi:NTP pyrophosphatase (non-canonical NTP hydrolase)